MLKCSFCERELSITAQNVAVDCGCPESKRQQDIQRERVKTWSATRQEELTRFQRRRDRGRRGST